MAQQFQVPQFIDYEARLIGPFTIKQSVTLGLAGIIVFVLWFVVEKLLFFPIAFLIMVLTILLTFIKVNGRPLSDFFTSFFSFFVSPQLYIWQKKEGGRSEKEKFVKEGGPPAGEEEEETKEFKKEQVQQFIRKLKK